jgi:hypothetical protein
MQAGQLGSAAEPAGIRRHGAEELFTRVVRNL